MLVFFVCTESVKYMCTCTTGFCICTVQPLLEYMTLTSLLCSYILFLYTNMSWYFVYELIWRWMMLIQSSLYLTLSLLTLQQRVVPLFSCSSIIYYSKGQGMTKYHTPHVVTESGSITHALCKAGKQTDVVYDNANGMMGSNVGGWLNRCLLFSSALPSWQQLWSGGVGLQQENTPGKLCSHNMSGFCWAWRVEAFLCATGTGFKIAHQSSSGPFFVLWEMGWKIVQRCVILSSELG